MAPCTPAATARGSQYAARTRFAIGSSTQRTHDFWDAIRLGQSPGATVGKDESAQAAKGAALVRVPRNTREFLAYPEGLGSPFEGIEIR